jgi:hypothetical protein
LIKMNFIKPFLIFKIESEDLVKPANKSADFKK